MVSYIYFFGNLHSIEIYMSHFAKVENNIVTEVLVAEQDFIDTLTNKDAWVQTSYNTRGGIHYAPNSNTPDNGIALRANYAGVGYTYDNVNDVFYAPQPYPSWTISSPDWMWKAPVPYPTDNELYDWDETTTNWVKVK
jgi:hypothetical protein